MLAVAPRRQTPSAASTWEDLMTAYRTPVLIFALAVFIGWPLSASAVDPSLSNVPTKGTDHVQGVPFDGGRLQGDTVEDPFVIDNALFFHDTGNTCGFTNDYEETCPYDESLSPDVVYQYTATTSLNLRVDLCASIYDTKVYVYDFAYGYGFGNPLACNDDACGVSGWRSQLDFFAETGHTYHIVVDGYSGDCGDYTIDVYEIIIEWLECPAGASLEGEPDCHDGYVDQFNGGCNSTPPVFSSVPCSPTGETITICGTSGTYDDAAYRDTDWYELNITETNTITFMCTAMFPLAIFMIDGNNGCEGLTILEYGTAGIFETATLTHTFLPGTYWLWVGPSSFTDIDCGTLYVMTVTGYTSSTSPTEAGTWGEVKQAFR
jgi:hypothetical protein